MLSGRDVKAVEKTEQEQKQLPTEEKDLFNIGIGGLSQNRTNIKSFNETVKTYNKNMQNIDYIKNQLKELDKSAYSDATYFRRKELENSLIESRQGIKAAEKEMENKFPIYSTLKNSGLSSNEAIKIVSKNIDKTYDVFSTPLESRDVKQTVPSLNRAFSSYRGPITIVDSNGKTTIEKNKPLSSYILNDDTVVKWAISDGNVEWTVKNKNKGAVESTSKIIIPLSKSDDAQLNVVARRSNNIRDAIQGKYGADKRIGVGVDGNISLMPKDSPYTPGFIYIDLVYDGKNKQIVPSMVDFLDTSKPKRTSVDKFNREQMNSIIKYMGVNPEFTEFKVGE